MTRVGNTWVLPINETCTGAPDTVVNPMPVTESDVDAAATMIGDWTKTDG